MKQRLFPVGALGVVVTSALIATTLPLPVQANPINPVTQKVPGFTSIIVSPGTGSAGGAVNGVTTGVGGTTTTVTNSVFGSSVLGPGVVNIGVLQGQLGNAAVIQAIAQNSLFPTTTAIAGVALITPVDQNLLYGSNIARNIDTSKPLVFPPVSNPNPAQLDALLRGLPAETPATEVTSYQEMVADLLRESGQNGTTPPDLVDGASVISLAEVPVSAKLTPTPGSTVTLTIQYKPGADGQIPDLVFRDPETNNYVAVKGSSTVSDSMRVDAANGIIDVVLDSTSVPSLPAVIGALPGNPVNIASAGAAPQHPGSPYLAVANDGGPISGYLTSESKKGDIFIVNEKTSGYYYANVPCGLSQGTLAPGLVAVCDAGALINERDDQVTVFNGRVLLGSGSESCSVHAPGAAVQIPNDASAVLEYNRAASMARIAVVSQRNDAPASIKTSVGRPLFVKPGKSVSVYQELPVLKQIKLFTASKDEVPMKAMISKLEDFDASKVSKNDGSSSFCRAVVRASEPGNSDPERLMHGGISVNAPVRMLASDKTIFSLDHNSIFLQTGDIFLHSAGEVGLKTEVADVTAKSQSDFVVSYIPGRERIDVLSGPGLLSLSVHGKATRLNPGQEIVASTQPFSQSMLLPGDGIARRCFQTDKVGDTNVSSCDFEISSMLIKSTYLKCLRNPHNSFDGFLRARLLKTACAVTYATSGRGKYFAR